MPIRPFVRSDIPAVADLFVRMFRPDAKSKPAQVEAYMDEVYFRHPWRDLRVHSLVLGGDPGDVQGFLGVIPRPMDFGGQRIVAAITGSLMVRPDDRRVPMFAALRLMRRLLAGEQDVILTETANDAGRKVFLAAGGTTVRLYSFGWHLPIRSFAARMHEISRPTVRVLTRPLCSMADWLCSRGGRRPWSLAGVRREPLHREVRGPALVTSGDDIAGIVRFVPHGAHSYSARDVIEGLLAGAAPIA